MAADSLLHLPSKESEQRLATDGSARGPVSTPVMVRPPAASAALLLLDAWARLAFFDLLSLLGYKRVSAFTKSRRVTPSNAAPETVPQVCSSVEEACVWYVKRVYCLQRSTVATWMLRSRGIKATLVIGYRPVPVDSHAWVEVDQQVVNDRPQYQKFYQVLERL
jgi:hypothetical protein